MSSGPCKNQSCSSYGTPHPNCKCYGGMAAGGVAEPFCSSSRAHEAGCQYFADAGEVIDPNAVVMDQPESAPVEAPAAAPVAAPEQAQAPAAPTGEIPSDQVIMDSPIPEEEVTPDEPGGRHAPSMPQSPGDVGRRLLAGDLSRPPEDQEQGLGRPMTEEDMKQAGGAEENLATLMGMTMGMPGINPATEGAAKYAGLGKTGTAMIASGLTNGVFQGGNEVSNWLMGRGDPKEPVGAALARIGVAMFLGPVATGAGAGAKAALIKTVESRLGGKLMGFLAGVASAMKPGEERKAVDEAVKVLHDYGHAPAGSTMESYKAGQKTIDQGLQKTVKEGSRAAGTVAAGPIGGVIGGWVGSGIEKALQGPLGNMVERAVRPSARKVALPVTLKILSSGGADGLLQAIGHGEQVAAGNAMADGIVSDIMKGIKTTATKEGGAKAADAMTRKKLDDYIRDGGMNQNVQQEMAPAGAQGFAKGGEVKAPKTVGGLHDDNHGLAKHYPEQNMLMQAAKGRISNYLSSLRPQANQPKLAFDDEPDNRDHKKSYERALDIAISPLSVMHKIQDGSIEPEHVQHFNAMHPELQSLLQKKITEQITQAQMDGKKPPYMVRQGLSLFMGTALSGELTPQAIQAAQSAFAKKPAPEDKKQEASKPKDSKALSKTEQSYLTSGQALTLRQNRV